MTILQLTLEYDGTGFRGWARQPGQRTVEGALRDALDALYPGWTGLRSPGGPTRASMRRGRSRGGGERRAAGIPGGSRAEHRPAVRRRRARRATRRRGSTLASRPGRAPTATSCSTAPRAAALDARRALWWPRPVDDEKLTAAAALLSGTHDFSAFTPAVTQHELFRRTIRAAAWERRGDHLHFTITADSFLRHMVRTLVGTMLETTPERVAELLLADGRGRREARPHHPGACTWSTSSTSDGLARPAGAPSVESPVCASLSSSSISTAP